jgi:putative ABC transport system permease protein
VAPRGEEKLAIRSALGSSRWRLFGEHLTESWVLAAVGGTAGVLIAYAVIQWFVSTRQDMSRVEAIHMDGLVVGFAVGLVFLFALFAGVISSVSTKGDQVLPALQESGRLLGGGRDRVRLHKSLLTLEVGLTVVLLIGAGLLLKSYERLRASDLGCITRNVLTMRLNLPETAYSDAAKRLSFFEMLLARVRSLPGVQAAGFGSMVPGQGYWGDNGFAIAEHPPLAAGQIQSAVVRWADPGYFAALGIRLLRGQTFDENQRLEKATKVIVSDSFVRRYLPDEDPFGKHLLTLGRKSYEVVGVVGDTRWAIAKSPEPMMYFPLYAGRESGGTLSVRSNVDVTTLALPIQQVVQQLDPDLPVSDILTIEQIIGKSTTDANFDTTLILAFAVLSLLLAP